MYQAGSLAKRCWEMDQPRDAEERDQDFVDLGLTFEIFRTPGTQSPSFLETEESWLFMVQAGLLKLRAVGGDD